MTLCWRVKWSALPHGGEACNRPAEIGRVEVCKSWSPGLHGDQRQGTDLQTGQVGLLAGEDKTVLEGEHSTDPCSSVQLKRLTFIALPAPHILCPKCGWPGNHTGCAVAARNGTASLALFGASVTHSWNTMCASFSIPGLGARNSVCACSSCAPVPSRPA